jgi:hypothetical protein
MSVFERLGRMDRRVIFLMVALAVVVPLFLPLGLPVGVTPPVKQLYDVIEGLPRRSAVLMSIDYDPSGAPELQPATVSVMRHCFRRDLRVVVLGLWAPGVPLGMQALEEVAVEEYGKTYGEDFVNFGYRPGGAVTLVNLGQDVHDVCRQDVYGTPVEEIPMMDDVRSARDFGLVISMSMGVPGSDQWIWYYHARYRGNLATAQTAIGAPRYYQYLQSGQLVGLIGGMKGAAEYEVLVDKRGLATTGMESQSIAHLLIVGLVLLGNLIYWTEKHRKRA